MTTGVASSLFSEPITVRRIVQTVGADGRPHGTAAESQVRGAFRHRVSIDGFNDGLVATDEAVVYLPPDTEVEPGDVLVVRGDDYSVVSTGFPIVNFRTGQAHHLEVRMRRSQR